MKKYLDILKKIQFIYAEKEKFGFFTKLKLKTRFGIGASKFWETESEKIIETIKATYYPLKKTELETELAENEKIVVGFNPSDVYEKCLITLRSEIANR